MCCAGVHSPEQEATKSCKGYNTPKHLQNHLSYHIEQIKAVLHILW